MDSRERQKMRLSIQFVAKRAYFRISYLVIVVGKEYLDVLVTSLQIA